MSVSAPASQLLPMGLMLASGTIHAFVNAVARSGQDKLVSWASINICSGLVALPVLLIMGGPGRAWPWLMLSTIAHAGYLFALIKAFERADLSVTYPIVRGAAPMMVAAGAILFLGENVTVLMLAGVALICLSVLSLGLGRHAGPAAIGWALVSSGCVAMCTVLDARGIRAAPNALGYVATLFVAVSAWMAVLLVWVRGRAVLTLAATSYKSAAVAGALSFLSYAIALCALRLGPAFPNIVLREIGIPVAVIISVVAFREPLSRARLAAIVGIMVGIVFLLTLGRAPIFTERNIEAGVREIQTDLNPARRPGRE